MPLEAQSDTTFMSREARPEISIVLATHNRRQAVLHTLQKLHECGYPRKQMEIIVVDNASNEGTRQIAANSDVFIPLRKNRGSCAKAYGVDVARGEYIVFLDDDSFPWAGTIERMIEHFESDSNLGCAAFQVHLPDGRRESSALPGVFVGCGVGFRAAALRQVGGLDRTFFMQAEEYDLSFRLASAGWRVEVFDDLHVDHLKTATARRSDRTTMYDIRNNLRVIARYLPADARSIYREDWTTRYRWLAERDGHRRAFHRGRLMGDLISLVERAAYRRHRLPPDVFERFFQWQFVEREMRGLRPKGVRRILLADLGKNVYAFHRGARIAGLEIAAIADDRFAASGRTYRGTPVINWNEACDRPFDAVIVSNMSPVHARRTWEWLRRSTEKPVYSWYDDNVAAEGAVYSPAPVSPPDDKCTPEMVVGVTSSC